MTSAERGREGGTQILTVGGGGCVISILTILTGGGGGSKIPKIKLTSFVTWPLGTYARGFANVGFKFEFRLFPAFNLA